MIASVEKGRYIVRWRTDVVKNELRITGWDVVDTMKFDNMTIATYPDRATAQAMVNLLNKQEKIERS